MKVSLNYIIFLGTLLFSLLQHVNALTRIENVEDEKSGLVSHNTLVVVNGVSIRGNYITKEKVISNEMLMGVGDALQLAEVDAKIERSRQNLLNTQLFNFVSIQYIFFSTTHIDIIVSVEERWYWWVLPIFEHADRNFSAFIDNGDWGMVNYGLYLKRENFRGRREILKLNVKTGYRTYLRLFYDSPEYQRNFGWGLDVNYLTQRKVAVETKANRPVFLTSFEEYSRKFFMSTLFVKFRHHYNHRHRLGLEFKHQLVSDTLFHTNPNYLFDQAQVSRYFNLSYTYLYDTRDSKVFPLKGNLSELNVVKYGLGITDSKADVLQGKFRGGMHFQLASKWYVGNEIYANLTNVDSYPYALKIGVGYENFINGFEYNVIEGPSYAYAKHRLMFNLIPSRVKNINFISLPQFSKIHYALFLNAHFDYGYVYNPLPKKENFMANQFLYGYGLGLDVVTYYDFVVSLNYSINKFGSNGFFIHINLSY